MIRFSKFVKLKENMFSDDDRMSLEELEDIVKLEDNPDNLLNNHLSYLPEKEKEKLYFKVRRKIEAKDRSFSSSLDDLARNNRIAMGSSNSDRTFYGR